MKFLVFVCVVPVICALLVCCAPCCYADGSYPPFNVRVGTQTFGAKYRFTDSETTLVETARRIDELGCDIIKFALKDQTYESEEGPATLREAAESEASCRTVLDMPFLHYFLWCYPLGVKKRQVTWRDGMDEREKEIEYRQIYDLACYLLRQYKGSGKSFHLGHWEGDWTLLGHYDSKRDPSTKEIEGFMQWLEIRQKAVDDANRDEPTTDCHILNYSEVNLVSKAVEGHNTLVNTVLPKVNLDLVSYSSYDGLSEPFPQKLLRNLDFISTCALTKSDFHKRVFIGEYGYPLHGGQLSPRQQGEKTKEFIKAAGKWGCPFILYWEMYDNESGDESKGFWLIDNKDAKQPSWYVHHSFLGRAHAFKNLYRILLDRNPTEDEFDRFCASFDTFKTSEEFDRILSSDEWRRTFKSPEFLRIVSQLSGRSADSLRIRKDSRDLLRYAFGENRSRWRTWLDSEMFFESQIKTRRSNAKNAPEVLSCFTLNSPKQ